MAEQVLPESVQIWLLDMDMKSFTDVLKTTLQSH